MNPAWFSMPGFFVVDELIDERQRKSNCASVVAECNLYWNWSLEMAGLKCEFELIEALGMVIIWVILIVITLGLAAFIMPYYFAKAPINKTFVVDVHGQKVGRLKVDFNLGQVIGHALVWLLLSIVTFGLAYLVYWFAVYRKLLNASVIASVSEQSLMELGRGNPIPVEN